MPKYYIKSGDLKYIIDRPNAKKAIIDTLKISRRRRLSIGPKICINERGFDSFKQWTCEDTQTYNKDI